MIDECVAWVISDLSAKSDETKLRRMMAAPYEETGWSDFTFLRNESDPFRIVYEFITNDVAGKVQRSQTAVYDRSLVDGGSTVLAARCTLGDTKYPPDGVTLSLDEVRAAFDLWIASVDRERTVVDYGEGELLAVVESCPDGPGYEVRLLLNPDASPPDRWAAKAERRTNDEERGCDRLVASFVDPARP